MGHPQAPTAATKHCWEESQGSLSGSVHPAFPDHSYKSRQRKRRGGEVLNSERNGRTFLYEVHRNLSYGGRGGIKVAPKQQQGSCAGPILWCQLQALVVGVLGRGWRGMRV